MMNGFVEKNDKLKDELEDLKRYPKSQINRYNKYFKIEEASGAGFSYSKDSEK